MEPRELLVYVQRERLGLTGTNVGCDTSSCGACTVLVGGESVKSCTMLGVQADEVEITTIEGLADNGTLHPVQQAFHENHGLQCGFCTPGMVLAVVSLLDEGDRSRRRSAWRSRQPLPLHGLSATSSRRSRAAATAWRRDGCHRGAGLHRASRPAARGRAAHR